MEIRAYNSCREAHGGPFDTFKDAFIWADKWLPGGILQEKWDEIESYEKELLEDGRTMIMETGGEDSCMAEDIVIFDALRFPPDEDGYIEW